MRLDTANRSFFTLVALAAAPFVLIAVAGCGVLAVAAYRVATDGWHAASAALLPAAAITVLVTVGGGRAAWSWRTQAAATDRLVRKVRALAGPAPARLQQAAARAGLAGRVDFVEAAAPFSFAYGLTRPRVAVSGSLLGSASEDELDAVLTHERHHVANRDPLKVVIARVLAAALFFLPALRGLRERYSAASELAADRRALGSCGRVALAGALARVVRGPAWDELATAAAIGGPELLEVRVAQLETGEEPPLATVPTSAVVLTGVVLALLAVVFVATLLAAGPEVMGPMDGSDMDGGVAARLLGPLVWAALIGAVVWRARRHRRTSTRLDTTPS